MKIGILDCDDIAPELIEDYSDYASMFQTLLSGTAFADREPQYISYKVCHNVFPRDVHECDAYLVTGSKTGVYDDVTWRNPLRDFVLDVYKARVRIVGICFGHQLLADTLGGCAEKSEKGWGIGALTHTKQGGEGYFDDLPDTLTLLFSHQDQVKKLPEDAVRLYGSEFCENGAFLIPGRALAFQGHPEFTHEYSSRLMRLREERYPPARYQEGLSSLSQDTQHELVAQWMMQFLYGDKG